MANRLVDERLERRLSATVDDPRLVALSRAHLVNTLDVPRLVGRLHREHLHHLSEVRIV